MLRNLLRSIPTQLTQGGGLLRTAMPPKSMIRGTVLGAALTVLGVAGYAIGVFVDYPGRAFSLTAVMVGIVLITITRRPTAGDGQ